MMYIRAVELHRGGCKKSIVFQEILSALERLRNH